MEKKRGGEEKMREKFSVTSAADQIWRFLILGAFYLRSDAHRAF